MGGLHRSDPHHSTQRVRCWSVERVRSTVRALHERPLPEAVSPTVWIAEPTDSAIVLGSTQSDRFVDRRRADQFSLDVVRRRSGGGAVLVDENCLWLDVVIPVADPLWDDDIGRSFHWLGSVWRQTLAELGLATSVHLGAFARTPLSDVVCFAGRGPGEVLVDDAGHMAKVVGISQRRTRNAARFQCAAQLRWDPEPLVAVFAPAFEHGSPLDIDEVRACGHGIGIARSVVIDAFEQALAGA